MTGSSCTHVSRCEPASAEAPWYGVAPPLRMSLPRLHKRERERERRVLRLPRSLSRRPRMSSSRTFRLVLPWGEIDGGFCPWSAGEVDRPATWRQSTVGMSYDVLRLV